MDMDILENKYRSKYMLSGAEQMKKLMSLILKAGEYRENVGRAIASLEINVNMIWTRRIYLQL